MSLFASNKTVKLYFDQDGKITDKETEDWVEVYQEVSTLAVKKLQQAFGKPKMEYRGDQQIVTFEDMDSLPTDFLAEVIVKWSEKDAVTPENILRKMRYDTAQNLYNKLNEMYKLR